jgi:hypothetical protein
MVQVGGIWKEAEAYLKVHHALAWREENHDILRTGSAIIRFQLDQIRHYY